jgi:hypothetical protein
MKGDLVVLVADRNAEAAIEGLLTRGRSLGLEIGAYRIFVHPEKDPGCRLHGHELLRIHQKNYQFALMLFDREGCGAEDKLRDELEREAEQRLEIVGWKDRCGVIVLEPELDIWIWSDSPLVDEHLNWSGRNPKLREWLKQQGYVFADGIKPVRPKEALEKVLREVRKPRSSSLYKDLASVVGLERCVDPAFHKLRALLQKWFPLH